MKTQDEKAAEEYEATLSELNSNSKVEINALTMLAEDNKDHAVSIAACIENQLKMAPNRRKLPLLYLIDSICKNYPKSVYVQLFTQNIVSNFCNVFEVSDERVRRSLHKLRMTWDTTKTFPPKKLNAIDERVNKMDPNWPILHKISSVPQRTGTQTQQPANSVAVVESSLPTKRGNNNQAGGRRSKRPKITQNRPNLIDQGTIQVAPATFIDPGAIQVTPTTYLDPSITMPQQSMPATALIDQNLIIVPNEPQIPMMCATPQFTQSLGQIPPQPDPPAQPQPQAQPLSQESQPAYVSILESLYGGKQCSNCSLRFDENNKYAIHLDWHFRQNLRSTNVLSRRKWYYPLNLWAQFRDMNDDEVQENSNEVKNVNEMLPSVDEHEVPTAPASKDDAKNICSVCHEAFEKFWAEEEEEWRLRNAKQYEDTENYHPLCLMDKLQAGAYT